MKRIIFAIVVVAITSQSFVGSAQPLAEHLPADTILYLGWRGSEDLGDGYANSHLKAMIEMSQIQTMISDVLPKAFEKLADQVPDPDAQQAADFMSTIGVALWKYPTAICLAGVDLKGPQPSPQFALVCDAGKDAAALHGQLAELIENSGPSPTPVKVHKVQQRVILTVGNLNGDLQGALGLVQTFAPVPRLADAGPLKSALKRTIKDPVFVAYVDVERVMELVDTAVVMDAGGADDPDNVPQDVQKWRQFKELSGIDGLKRATVASGFDGRQWGTRAYIEAPAPRRGLVALLEQSVVSDELLAAIPETASMAGAFGLDVAALVDMAKDAAAQVDPQAAQQIDGAIQQFGAQLKIDLMDDLLRPLGSEWATYIDENTSSSGAWGTVAVNRLRDAERFEKTMSKLEVAINQFVAAQMEEQGEVDFTMRFRSAEVDGTTLHYLATPLLSPCWAVRDGNLYVALQPQFVASAAHHVASGGASILTNQGFVDQRKQLGVKRFGSFTFVDVAKVAPDSISLVTAISRIFVGMGDMAGVEKTPAMMVPPMYKLKPHLTPAVSFSLSDDTGYYLRSVEAFPGSTILSIGTKGGLWSLYSMMIPLSVMSGMSEELQLNDLDVEEGFPAEDGALQDDAVESIEIPEFEVPEESADDDER